jgi:hypothetical protein
MSDIRDKCEEFVSSPAFSEELRQDNQQQQPQDVVTVTKEVGRMAMGVGL